MDGVAEMVYPPIEGHDDRKAEGAVGTVCFGKCKKFLQGWIVNASLEEKGKPLGFVGWFSSSNCIISRHTIRQGTLGMCYVSKRLEGSVLVKQVQGT